MSNFPNQIDDDVTLPPVNNNLTEIGSEAINALRDAVFNIEEEIGVGASGSKGTIAARLGVTFNDDGYIKPSMIAALGLVSLPIYNKDIADDAKIEESKLKLDKGTLELWGHIQGLAGYINTANDWINWYGIKLQPHIDGIKYNHPLKDILVSKDSNDYLTNRFNLNNPPFPDNYAIYRNNANAFALISDINNDYVTHQKSDGYYPVTPGTVYTLGGYSYPSNFAHTAAGIHLNTQNYTVIPLETDSVQKLADYIDANSIFLLASRVQNLFTSGISRSSRSSTLSLDGYGSPIVPLTQVSTYLINNGGTSPWDSPNNGDDIIRFFPTAEQKSGFKFDSQFSLVKAGDVIRVNYGSIETEFTVKEKKYIPDVGGNSTYAIRIDGKNLLNLTDGYAQINRPLFNPNKFGVLSVSPAQILDNLGNAATDIPPSLIVSHPRGAVALGNVFDASLINSSNYKLYLVLYPTGNPIDGEVKMPPVDITGNKGVTPGAYTLESIVYATNNSFRKSGFNCRFSAFSYQGQFGIMLNESYNNASFSIVGGYFNGTQYTNELANNIITYDVSGNVISDPLGFGKNKANIASPLFSASRSSAISSYFFPTKVFSPLRRNNYYVDGVGVESDKFAHEPYQYFDEYGDGYWTSTVVAVNAVPNSRVEVTYRVNKNLTTTGLAVGKTLVVQSSDNKNQINFGRFTIKSIAFNVCGGPGIDQTDITVWDAVHGNYDTNGFSPPSSPLPNYFASTSDGYQYKLYFNSDSVSFNSVNSSDNFVNSNYKRHFEIYLTKEGKTLSLERARMNISGSAVDAGNGISLDCSNSQIAKINIVRVSPKLRGYGYGTVDKITLYIENFDAVTGLFSGKLLNRDSGVDNNLGPSIVGKRGEITRFYDETGIDYIDFVFDLKGSINTFQGYISLQLFPTLALDDEFLLLSSAQINGISNTVDYILDLRQFGNISEKDLSTSALKYLSTPERLIHANGVVRGFKASASTIQGLITFSEGGTALVNGNFVNVNNASVKIPTLQEIISGSPQKTSWALCVNDKNDYQFVALLDGGNSRDISVADVSKFNWVDNQYKVNSLFFKDLINSKKDLTPLYIVSVDGYYNSSTQNIFFRSVILSDVRKFINSEPLNNAFTWADTSASNNIVSYFHNFDAVKNWLNYYGSVSNKIIIKGKIQTEGTLDFSQISVPTIFEGDGSEAGFVMSNAPALQMGSNITFKNIKFKFLSSGSLTQLQNNSNCVFDNVEFIFDTFDITSTISISIKNNNIFNNCIFSKITTLSMLSGNKFVDCSFDSISAASTSNAISLSSENKFIGCNFASIRSVSGNILSSSTLAASDVFSNTFDQCLFGIINSSSGAGFIFSDNNKITRCKFLTDINVFNTIFEFRDGNLFEDVLFGTDPNSVGHMISANQISSGSDLFFLKARSNNIFKSFSIRNIQCSSSTGTAIKIYGENNLIDSFYINSVVSTDTGILITTESENYQAIGNKITNGKIGSIKSPKGITLNSGNTTDSGGSQTLIEKLSLNYSPAIAFNLSANDRIKFSGGGAIYCGKEVSNIKIKDCIFYQNAVPSGTTATPICNGTTADYMVPPLICFAVPPTGRVVESVSIDSCKFVGSDSIANVYYAAIAFIVTQESSISPSSRSPSIFSNIIVTNNTCSYYNGFIMAGESGKSYLKTINVIVNNNIFSYISAYSSPNFPGSNILIDGNTCDAIFSLNYFGSGQITSTPKATGSMIINDNTVKYIYAYVNDINS